jgi:hypothetical protein
MSLQFPRSIRPFSLSIAAALALSACGGGGGSDTPAAVAGTQTGVFVDSAVEGLSYETSSGVKGTTDAQGRFKYNEGDTVTFKAGGVTLGSGKATGTVTPAHISGGEDTNKFTNLLVLLQSLDTDGDPSNGITLPANLDGTKLAKVAERLNDDPADFTDDSKNGELKEASPQKAIRTRDDARKHYEDTQGKTSAFLDDASGVWTGYDDNDRYEAVLRLTPSGRYVLQLSTYGQSRPEAGLEVGTLAIDPTTGLITTSDIKTDTNGDAGWSKLGPDRSVKIEFKSDGEGGKNLGRLITTLKVKDQADVVLYFDRVTPSRRSVEGAWSTSPDLRANAGLVVFQYGNYTYVAPEGAGDCTVPGAQIGNYRYEVPVSLPIPTNLGPAPGSVGPSAPVAPAASAEPAAAPKPVLRFTNISQFISKCNVLGQAASGSLPPQFSEDGLTLTVFKPDESGEVLFKLYRIRRDKDDFTEDRG